MAASTMFPNARDFSIHGGEFYSAQGNQYVSHQDPKILHEIIMRKLTYSPQAVYDADVGIRLVRKSCNAGTREQILSDLEKWAKSNNPYDAFGYWMCGMAGTGKSTIAMSFCMRLQEKGLLAGTFFCSHQIPEIVPTLAYQLAKFSGIFADSLKNILQEDPDHPVRKPEEQIKTLLVQPWNAAINEQQIRLYTPVLVVDALDECEGVLLVLKPLIAAIQEKELPGLKFFLTSCPEQAIQQLIDTSNLKQYKSISYINKFLLHQVEESLIQEDIYNYVKTELNGISSSEKELQQLTLLSGKLFIYAATMVKHVKGGRYLRRKQQRLADSLDQSNHYEDLDQLYDENSAHFALNS